MFVYRGLLITDYSENVLLCICLIFFKSFTITGFTRFLIQLFSLQLLPNYYGDMYDLLTKLNRNELWFEYRTIHLPHLTTF
ncbi:hypothetical protein JCM19376_25650 [Fusibacter bizertensis]